METVAAPGIGGHGTLSRIDPTGLWEWTGQRWISTLAPDGHARWNGHTWIALPNRYGSVVVGIILALVLVATALFGLALVTTNVDHLFTTIAGPRDGFLAGYAVVLGTLAAFL